MANENSVVTITVRPIDEDGTAFVPTNARYRLDDKSSGAAIIGWTAVSAADLSTAMEITIAASNNAIINPDLVEETKVFTFETDYGTDDAHNDEFEYDVTNLQFVS